MLFVVFMLFVRSIAINGKWSVFKINMFNIKLYYCYIKMDTLIRIEQVYLFSDREMLSTLLFSFNNKRKRL